MTDADELREGAKRLQVLSAECDQLQRSSDERRIVIGVELNKLKDVFDRTAQNMTWREWVEEHSGRSYRDANRCMAYARAPDPMAALVADREKNAEQAAATRRRKVLGTAGTDVSPEEMAEVSADLPDGAEVIMDVLARKPVVTLTRKRDRDIAVKIARSLTLTDPEAMRRLQSNLEYVPAVQAFLDGNIEALSSALGFGPNGKATPAMVEILMRATLAGSKRVADMTPEEQSEYWAWGAALFGR